MAGFDIHVERVGFGVCLGHANPAIEEGREFKVPLSEEEAHILQCLGAAVLSQWNGLPTRIQRELFEHSFDVTAPLEVARLKRRIARFLHEHKDDAGGSE